MWKTSLTHFLAVIKHTFNDTTLISERNKVYLMNINKLINTKYFPYT